MNWNSFQVNRYIVKDLELLEQLFIHLFVECSLRNHIIDELIITFRSHVDHQVNSALK